MNIGEQTARYLSQVLIFGLFHPASIFSIFSLFGALCGAMAFLLLKRGSRPLPFRVLMRALFPRRLTSSASGRADIGFALWSLFLSAAMLSWAVVSAEKVAGIVAGALSRVAIPPPPTLPPLACHVIATVAWYLTYEIAYWAFHYASHRIPALWAFHKVHHSAETLSPLTITRIHPVESILYANFLGLCFGLTGGLLNYGFGDAMKPFSTDSSNLIKIALLLTIIHLQHSELWIPATGRLGRFVLSPAHHQIHHSSDPAHFDKNFGFFLAIWDRMFGTLCVPEKIRQPIRFGVADEGYNPHGLRGALLMPLHQAWIALRPSGRRQVPEHAPDVGVNLAQLPHRPLGGRGDVLVRGDV